MLRRQLKAALARVLNPDEASTATLPAAPPLHEDKERPNDKPDQVTQLLLKLHYEQLVQQGLPLPGFRDVQFKAHSQTGEDGLLLYVFAVIGTTNKRCVEICAGAGIECNTANLIINHGWTGLLIDGDDTKLQRGREFYRKCQSTSIWPPYLANRWVTRENVNTILQEMNYSGKIDLLSLDLDGNDYWIWDAIEIIDPRVVMLEYQSAWGPEKRVTQRYQENFNYLDVKVQPGFPRCGASLAAFVSLGRKKGYRLVGCNHLCFNAVFIKRGIGEAHFPEILAHDCFEHDMPKYRMTIIEGKDIPVPEMWETV